MSVAVALKVTGVLLPVASTSVFPVMVITGFVVSIIVIFCTPSVTFPFSSVAVQVTGVVPIGKSTGALFLTVTLKMSVAVAVPIATGVLIAVASTFKSCGNVSNGFVVSTTLTICSPVDTFPLESFTVHTTVVFPKGKMLSVGALLVVVVSNISSTIGVPVCTGVVLPVASKVISAGISITGFFVSVTVIFCIPSVTFPFESVAFHITLVVPTPKSAGLSLFIVTGNISVAVASPIFSFILLASASIVISSGTFNTGFVVSTTLTF